MFYKKKAVEDSVTVRMEYLLSNSDIVNFVWKTDEGETESIFLLIFVLYWCLIVGGWGMMRWGKLPAEIASFSSRDFSWSNKHDTFWHILTGYFYVLFLWAIAVSDFRPLEIYKNLGLPLSTITYSQLPRRWPFI